jgi:hypothetical protein
VCRVCQFENFKRFRYCTVCGEPIEAGKADDEGVVGNTKKSKKLSSLRTLFKRGGHGHVELTSAATTSSPSKQVTRRQLRAQRRKEWTRKVDVEGRTYWFRDSRFGSTGDQPSTVFVVTFKAASSGSGALESPPEMQQQPSESTASDETLTDRELLSDTMPSSANLSDRDRDTPGSPSASEPDPELEDTLEGGDMERIRPYRPTIGSVEDCIAKLVKSAQELQPALVQASNADVNASRLPLTLLIGPNLTTLDIAQDDASRNAPASGAVAEAMDLARKDFPSKYAHFVMAASSLLVPAEKEHLRLNVERANVFVDSMVSLAIVPFRNVHSVLRIKFLEESGVDAGGLQREWFVMVNEALVEPTRGLFVCANKSEQTYYLSPCSSADLLPHQLLYLFAAGRVLGRALLEGSMLCFHLAPPLLKLMLGYPLSFDDLEDFDPEVYGSLRWLLENDHVDSLGLDFTVTVKDGDSHRDIELVPGGRDIAVTDSNKREYVERKWQYLLVESVAPQLQCFLRGLYEIIPRDLLLLFDPEEFDFLLCGSDEIDVDDWERNTKYSEDMHHHRALTWFWELVREMPNEYRRRLLQFSTGSSRVPLGGFSALTSYDGRLCPFTLKGVSLVGDGFIHSHACFNRLDLPVYFEREKMMTVLYA